GTRACEPYLPSLLGGDAPAVRRGGEGAIGDRAEAAPAGVRARDPETARRHALQPALADEPAPPRLCSSEHPGRAGGRAGGSTRRTDRTAGQPADTSVQEPRRPAVERRGRQPPLVGKRVAHSTIRTRLADPPGWQHGPYVAGRRPSPRRPVRRRRNAEKGRR